MKCYIIQANYYAIPKPEMEALGARFGELVTATVLKVYANLDDASQYICNAWPDAACWFDNETGFPYAIVEAKNDYDWIALYKIVERDVE